MFNYSKDKLEALGANVTTEEIKQQPELWMEVIENYRENEEQIQHFIDQIQSKHDHLRVIFAGAGTSAFVGEAVQPYLSKVHENSSITFEAIPTTEIVAKPRNYFFKDQPTLLVSFARSGNSPESLKTVELAEAIIDDLYHLSITCNPEGKLATQANTANHLLILQPERSNDKGFAMTSSYTCMLLTSLLIFDQNDLATKQAYIEQMVAMAEDIFGRYEQIEEIVQLDFERVVYLGAGSLFGLAHEAQLKLLELTAGQIATLYETPLGFRHGPKSFINDKTLVLLFNSNDDYADLYDSDLLNEVYHDQIAQEVLSLSVGKNEKHEAKQFVLDEKFKALPDAYLVLPYVIWAQIFAVMTAIKVGNTPDTPSASGTVNRVVKGVILHPFENN
ncbi:SIS domain-containing protein [Facklamia sp. DSM 111018]|uniref:SIS domain-containing protein n=1 Tax=Facklamia lactis TaxID=2749967 RepID=A0ABS0LNP1_9LACT|nr:SIS domain-containing protein [Facklamia lactis]MBG9979555.1 SIS domain-containing protein [Facklamia lactis]MBG9985776.1 SIS domain-containing protein [Facklamia lactis]